MGIFSKLKNLFNKNIECGDELNGRLLYLYPLKGRTVHVGASIIVNDGYNVVFVVNDRVSDLLPSGKHKIGGAVLPNTFSRLKLDKPNKKGNYPKNFKADVYYVNMQLVSQVEYTSNEPFFAKSDKFGRIKGYGEGLCDFQICSADKLLRVLLIDRPFIANKESKELATTLVGNEVNKMLEKSKINFTQIVLNPKVLNQFLNPAINEKTEVFGVKVYNLEVSSLKLNRRLQKKVSAFIAERNHVEQQFESSGIKYQPEKIVPDKVDITKSQALNYSLKESIVPSTSAPEIIKRGGNVSAPIANTNYESKNINSFGEILGEESKKVCKFCGETIDVTFAFCPKCGFKQ